jgi:hypothetical protein
MLYGMDLPSTQVGLDSGSDEDGSDPSWARAWTHTGGPYRWDFLGFLPAKSETPAGWAINSITSAGGWFGSDRSRLGYSPLTFVSAVAHALALATMSLTFLSCLLRQRLLWLWSSCGG